jgi:hypothetical protein
MRRQSLLLSALASAVCLSLTSLWAQGPSGKKAADRKRGEDRVRENDVAPDFELKTTDGKTLVKLSDFRGKKPVALVFGSYT